jgi:hypothetical protein
MDITVCYHVQTVCCSHAPVGTSECVPWGRATTALKQSKPISEVYSAGINFLFHFVTLLQQKGDVWLMNSEGCGKWWHVLRYYFPAFTWKNRLRLCKTSELVIRRNLFLMCMITVGFRSYELNHRLWFCPHQPEYVVANWRFEPGTFGILNGGPVITPQCSV